MPISIATVDSGRTSVDESTLDQFAASIRGELLKPGDSRFSEKPVYNAMHDRRPALIVRCTGTADVVDAIKFARQHNLLLAVRGGGHSVAGHSTCDNGIVIDLTRMRGVEVDPESRIARVQGGALWGDLDRETQAFGLVVPGGVVSETGVAGLTLGGGEGWVRRKYGLTIDSLLSARVVCADGSVRTASAQSEVDLFWALRGGGGNFGIVTSFEFRAHPLGPIVAFAGVFYRAADAAKILPRWRDYCLDAPDEVTSVAVAITMPAAPTLPPAIHNQACLVIGGVYAGGRGAGHENDAAAARAGDAAGRHLAADAVPRGADGVRSAVPDGQAPELLEGPEPRLAARPGDRDHRGQGEPAAGACHASGHIPDGRGD